MEKELTYQDILRHLEQASQEVRNWPAELKAGIVYRKPTIMINDGVKGESGT